MYVVFFCLVFLGASFCQDCRKPVPCDPDYQIHVVGMAGHGKSAIAQCLSGKDVPQGGVETTMKVETYLGNPYTPIIRDYPGFGTPTFPIDSWLRDFKGHFANNSSIIILVVGPRIYEQHKVFMNSLRQDQHLLLVRSQIDIFPITGKEFTKYWQTQAFTMTAPRETFVVSKFNCESIKQYIWTETLNRHLFWCCAEW